MKVSDYVISRLAGEGIDRVFLVYGAALGELADALTRSVRIKHVCPMHEQAGGFMAEGYAKVRRVPGFAMATSGPGAGNLVTCIQNAFYDSVPMIFITGQVTTRFQRPHEGIRQLGFQETDVVGMVKPITKYAAMVKRPEDVRYELEKAIHLCKSGRPGPVVLDMPIDVQRAEFDPASGGYEPRDEWRQLDRIYQLGQFLGDLERAKRPGILVGGGAYKARDYIIEFATKHNIPCFPTWNALDIITSDLPIYGGRIGTYGGPGRNFGIQNCDLVLAIGSRLSGRITGGMPETFVQGAKLYVVDVDENLLESRYQPRRADVNILCDALDFARGLAISPKRFDFSPWLARVRGWLDKYDNVRPEHFEGFHHYGFMRRLSEALPDNAIVVSDTGGNVIMMAHAFRSKRGQRIFTNNGNTPMGFSFAAAIGAWFADPLRPIICIIGDGGFNMNIQEIQTLVNHGAKVKTFIINNRIYGNTASYQNINFAGRCIASAAPDYVPPNFSAIAKAYGVRCYSLSEWEHFERIVGLTLQADEPVIVDVIHDGFCTYEPRISRFDLPIHDMFPFLERDEFNDNMRH